jgi:hypothetical protein
MFEDHPDGTYIQAQQRFGMAWLRLLTVVAFRPMSRLLRAAGYVIARHAHNRAAK